MNADRAAQSLQYFTELSRYVDRLSAKFPLRAHTSLRSQLRRCAMDSLAHAAYAFDEDRSEAERDLTRVMGALNELEALARMARTAGALSPAEEVQLKLLASQAARASRQSGSTTGETVDRADGIGLDEGFDRGSLALSGAA